MRAMLTWVRGGPASRTRPTVTASKGRSGRAAVRASRRSHAWRRWLAAQSREAHRVDDVASDVGDGAHKRVAVGQGDVDVQRGRLVVVVRRRRR